MHYGNSSVSKGWTVLRDCLQAANFTTARRVQSGYSRKQCYVPSREASGSRISLKGSYVHGQQHQLARAYATEPLSQPVSPVLNQVSRKSRAVETPVSGHWKAVASKDSVTRVLDDSQHPVRPSHIPSYAWPVLLDLKLAGHDAFVVGGTVRDIILGNTPKDVDLITSATLQQVKRLTRQCMIVGTRYPIALVRGPGGTTMEVATMHAAHNPPDAAAVGRLDAQVEEASQIFVDVTLNGYLQRRLRPEELSRSWSPVWRQDMLRRDFTVNAIMYDPFSQLLFDYMGGVADCAKQRLQCCSDPYKSFTDDPARMLRAVRLCSRTDLIMTRETQSAVKKLAPSIATLNGSRLALEVVNIFCHGGSLKTLHQIWKLQLLDVMMPPFVLYLQLHKIKRSAAVVKASRPSVPLLKMLYVLDQQSSVIKPAAVPVLYAVFASSLLNDAIATHSQQIQAVFTKEQGNATNRKQPKKRAKPAPRQQAKAFLTPIVNQAMQTLQERVHPPMKKEELEPENLFHYLVAATVQFLHNQFLVGMMTNANAAATERLLKNSWHNELMKSQEDTFSARTERRFQRKGDIKDSHFGSRKAQLQFNAILHESGIQWQKSMPLRHTS